MKYSVIRHGKADLWRYKLAKPVGGSGVSSVDVIVVELADDQGCDGIGFSYVLAGAGDDAARAAQRILDAHVIGKKMMHPEVLHREVRATFTRTGRGPLYIGLAAVDVGIWDLFAKQHDVPVGVAMGGASRAVKVYGSGGLGAGQDPDAAAEVARDYVSRGVSAVKPRAAGTPADKTLIERVVAAVQQKAFVAIDANEKCSLATAQWLLRVAADNGLLFVEEPLPAHDLAGHRALARFGGCTIATGEHLQGLSEAMPFLGEGMCGIVQPDLAMMGGLTECLRVSRAAEALGIEVAPHFLPNLFVHLAAASPNVTWLEDFPLLEPLFGNPSTFDKDGRLSPPEKPGHGLSWADGASDFRVALN